jgi:hypothetical protein
MSNFRSRIQDENTDKIAAAVLVMDDVVPLLGAISLIPIVINGSGQLALSQATILQATAITSGTLATVSLFIIAVSDIQTTRIGRYIALGIALPVVLLAIAGLPTLIFNILGLAIAAVAAVAIDITPE